MQKFKVWFDQEEDAEEVLAGSPEDAVEWVCHKTYDSGWSDSFVMKTRDESGTVQTHQVNVQVVTKFHVRTSR